MSWVSSWSEVDAFSGVKCTVLVRRGGLYAASIDDESMSWFLRWVGGGYGDVCDV